MEIDKQAPVIVRKQVGIDAPIEKVWQVFTDANRWTDWNKDIDSAALEGPLAVGSEIHWATAGLKIVSKVGEVIPQQRIVWAGETGGIAGVHHWQFTAVGNGTLVQTEESWNGEPVRKDIATAQSNLDQSLDIWVAALKRKCEG